MARASGAAAALRLCLLAAVAALAVAKDAQEAAAVPPPAEVAVGPDGALTGGGAARAPLEAALERELAATRASIEALNARLAALERLRADAVAGRASYSDVERLLGRGGASQGVVVTPSLPPAAPHGGLWRYLVPRRALAEPPPPPTPGPGGALPDGGDAARLVAVVLLPLASGGAPGGGGRVPCHVALRVHADGVVVGDTELAGAALCVEGAGTGAAAAASSPSAAAGGVGPQSLACSDGGAPLRLRDAIPGWDERCTVVAAALGELPAPTLLVAHSCGGVALLGVVVRHGGRTLAGHQRAGQVDALLLQAQRRRAAAAARSPHGGGGGADGDGNDDAAARGSPSGSAPTRVELYPSCSIQLPRGGGGGGAEFDVPTAVATHSTGAGSDRGNVVLVGTGVGGAVLAFHRNCTPARAVFTPQPRAEGGHGAPAGIAAFARQGTVVAFAAGPAVGFVSTLRLGTLDSWCALPQVGGGGSAAGDGPVHAASLAFDPAHPSHLWVGASDGSVLLFNTRALVAGAGRRAGDGVACRLLLVTLAPAPPGRRSGPQPLPGCLAAAHPGAASVAAVRGHLLVATGAGLAVFNTSTAFAHQLGARGGGGGHGGGGHGGGTTLPLAHHAPLPAGGGGSSGDEDTPPAAWCIAPAPPGAPSPPSPPLLLPQRLLALSTPSSEGSSQGAGGRGKAWGGSRSSPRDAQPPMLAVAGAPHPAALFEVALPRPAAGWGAAADPWGDAGAGGALGLLGWLVGALRGPGMVALVVGVVYFQASQARRKARGGDEDDGGGGGSEGGEGGGGGVWAADGGRRAGGARRRRPGDRGAAASTVRKGLGLLAQGASFFLLRGPLGVAARVAVARYKKRRAAEGAGGSGFFDDEEEEEEEVGFGDDDEDDDDAGGDGGGGDEGGRAGADRYERAIARMEARARMERELGALGARSSGAGGMRRLAGGVSRAAAEMEAHRAHLEQLQLQRRYERALRGEPDSDDDDGDLGGLPPGGGRPFLDDTDEDEDDAGVVGSGVGHSAGDVGEADDNDVDLYGDAAGGALLHSAAGWATLTSAAGRGGPRERLPGEGAYGPGDAPATGRDSLGDTSVDSSDADGEGSVELGAPGGRFAPLAREPHVDDGLAHGGAQDGDDDDDE